MSISVRYGPTPQLTGQILKRLEAQAAPDAVVSESPDVQNPQNKQPMSEPALHTPDVQDPQNKQPMSQPRLLIRQMRRILKTSGKCLSRLLTLPLNVAVSHEVLRWKGCPMQIGFSALAPRKSVHIIIAIIISVNGGGTCNRRRRRRRRRRRGGVVRAQAAAHRTQAAATRRLIAIPIPFPAAPAAATAAGAAAPPPTAGVERLPPVPPPTAAPAAEAASRGRVVGRQPTSSWVSLEARKSTRSRGPTEPDDCRSPAGGKAVCWRKVFIRSWAV